MEKIILITDRTNDIILNKCCTFWNDKSPKSLVMLSNLRINDETINQICIQLENCDFDFTSIKVQDNALYIDIGKSFSKEIENIYQVFLELPTLISDYLYLKGNLPSYCNYVLCQILEDISSFIINSVESYVKKTKDVLNQRELKMFATNKQYPDFRTEKNFFTHHSLIQVSHKSDSLLFPISISTEPSTQEVNHMIERNLRLIGKDIYVW